MTNDQIKKLLYNHSKINKWIHDYEIDLENIREQLDKHYSVHPTLLSDMPKSSNITDTTLKSVEEVDKLKTTYKKQANYIAGKLNKLYQEKNLIDSIIPSLNPTHQFILEQRYFRLLRWDDIAEADSLKRDKRVITNEHGKMLLKIKELLKEKRES